MGTDERIRKHQNLRVVNPTMSRKEALTDSKHPVRIKLVGSSTLDRVDYVLALNTGARVFPEPDGAQVLVRHATIPIGWLDPSESASVHSLLQNGKTVYCRIYSVEELLNHGDAVMEVWL